MQIQKRLFEEPISEARILERRFPFDREGMLL
jgi:hypothetical protein